MDQNMNMLPFTFASLELFALPSGALWWPSEQRLLVADLHFGKSERLARRGGALLPPYEVTETLERLSKDVAQTDAAEVICLGDSFDDPFCAARLQPSDRARLDSLKKTRRWIWVAGNHDPDLNNEASVDELRVGPLLLRHIARQGPLPQDTRGEVSGHYHPKHRLPTRGGWVTRRCFLVTPSRLVLPAYGAYTGGLPLSDPAFAPLLEPASRAILLGVPPVAVPLTIREAAE